MNYKTKQDKLRILAAILAGLLFAGIFVWGVFELERVMTHSILESNQ